MQKKLADLCSTRFSQSDFSCNYNLNCNHIISEYFIQDYELSRFLSLWTFSETLKWFFLWMLFVYVHLHNKLGNHSFNVIIQDLVFQRGSSQLQATCIYSSKQFPSGYRSLFHFFTSYFTLNCQHVNIILFLQYSILRPAFTYILWCSPVTGFFLLVSTQRCRFNWFFNFYIFWTIKIA